MTAAYDYWPKLHHKTPRKVTFGFLEWRSFIVNN